MTPADLELRLVEVLRSHWRTRAGLALMRSAPPFAPGSTLLEYQGLSGVGVTLNFMQTESVVQALAAVDQYEKERLTSDIFLLLIAEYETYLSNRLQAVGRPGEGTLGQLMNDSAAAFSLSGTELILAGEIRERRNCWIHHCGRATDKYMAAATAAVPNSSGFVVPVARGQDVAPTEAYLPYCVDVLVRYGRLLP